MPWRRWRTLRQGRAAVRLAISGKRTSSVSFLAISRELEPAIVGHAKPFTNKAIVIICGARTARGSARIRTATRRSGARPRAPHRRAIHPSALKSRSAIAVGGGGSVENETLLRIRLVDAQPHLSGSDGFGLRIAQLFPATQARVIADRKNLDLRARCALASGWDSRTSLGVNMLKNHFKGRCIRCTMPCPMLPII